MVSVEYDPNGTAIKDGDLEDASECIRLLTVIEPGQNTKLKYGNSNIFRKLRLEVAKGKIDFKRIIFIYKKNSFKIDKYGDYVNPPRGFLSNDYEMTKEIMSLQPKLEI